MKIRLNDTQEGWSLRELRERFDLTQKQLAAKLPHNQSWVSKVERVEVCEIGILDLVSYVEALGLTVVVELVDRQRP